MKIECEGARGRRRKKERERERGGKEVGRRRDRGSEG